MNPRIFLIHATPVAVDPINAAFARLWPAPALCNLLDDSLATDLAREGGLSAAMMKRFADLSAYAIGNGADAIMFTCSAFGPAIEAARQGVAIPVLKPNEAMIDVALAKGRRLGLVASFAASLPSIEEEMRAAARALGIDINIELRLAAGAMEALKAGDKATHDGLVVEAVKTLQDCDVVCFSQFSMQSAAAAAAAAIKIPLLTTPDSAVARLRGMLEQAPTRR